MNAARHHNVAWSLREHAETRPDTTALLFPSGRDAQGRTTWDAWTFAELDARASAYARGFAAHGLARGDRTLMLAKPSLDFYAVLFGLLQLGAVPVLLDPGMGIKPLLSCIRANAPRAMVAIPIVHAVKQVVRGPFATVELPITVGRRWFWGGPTLDRVARDGAGDRFDIPGFDADDEAAIVFTSGSTGTPKGVSYRHGMFRAQTAAIADMYGLGPGVTTVECFAPFAIFDLAAGATVVVPDMDLSKPAKADPARIVDAVTLNEAQVAFASPVVWTNTVRYCQERGLTLPTLDQVLSAGAPIPADLHRRFRDVLRPGAQVHTPYGATEALPVATIGTDAILGETWSHTARGEGTCVGHPVSSVDVRVIRITDDPIAEWSDDLCLPEGEFGELVVRGPQVSPEYKERPDANAVSKIADGDGFWHRMGDLAYLDDQGRIWFCGRKSHRLETARGTIPAVPVEGIFNEHPAIRRTALVGVGAPGAQEPVLFVELEAGHALTPALEAELHALADGTRWQGVVSRFVAHDGFPVDARHNSKIRREDLRAQATRQLAVEPR